MRLAPLIVALVLAGCATPAPGPDADAGAPDATLAREWSWTERAAAPIILAETAVAAEGPMVTIVGGWTQAGGGSPLAVRYDAQNDTWAQLPPYPLAVHHAQAAAIDGTVYVFGGAVTAAPLPGSVVGVGPSGWPRTPLSFKLAPGGSSWEPIAPLPEARGLGGAAALDGKVYLVGGVGMDGYLDVVHVYDPAGDGYDEGPALPTTRDHVNVVAHEGRIYALAGRTNAGGSWDDLPTVEVLDPANGTWTSLPDAPIGGGGRGAGVVEGGLVALVGGERLEGDFTVYDAAHAYDPAADAWRELPAMPEALHGMASASWDGSLYILGGATESAILDSTWMLAPQES